MAGAALYGHPTLSLPQRNGDERKREKESDEISSSVNENSFCERDSESSVRSHFHISSSGAKSRGVSRVYPRYESERDRGSISENGWGYRAGSI